MRNQVFKFSKSIMCNIIFTLLVFCSEFSTFNFKQFMFNFSQLLSLNEILIVLKLQKNNITCQILTYFIIIIVQTFYLKIVNFCEKTNRLHKSFKEKKIILLRAKIIIS